MLTNPMENITKWIYGPPNFRVLLIGEGGTGKTTFISQLLHGHAWETFPTMGHDLYPITYNRRTFSFWDTGMGCFRDPKWVQYLHSPDTSVLFFHDTTSGEEFLPNNLELLSRVGRIMRDVGYRSIWIVLNKRDCAPAQEIEYLRQIYYQKLIEIFDTPFDCKVIDYPVSTKTGEGVQRIKDDLSTLMTGEEKKTRQRAQNHCTTHMQPAQKAKIEHKDTDLRAQIKKEGAEDTMVLLHFWQSFLNADLLEWNHRSHLKAGYIVVLKSLKNGDNVFYMADDFLCHLKRLKMAKPENFRNTEHRTMTIFWLTQLQYAIIQFKSHQNTSEFPSWTDFQEVLLHTPSLINTRLWSVYYTKEHMFSTKARESWSLPDLQPLPGLLDSNYDAFSAQGKDPDRLLRYAFAVIQDTVKSGSRRGQVVKQALDSLQATTIRLRKKNTSMPPYSETQAYFWIQIVHAAIQSFNTAPDKSMNRSILDIPVSRLSSASFNALFDLNSGTWKQYYSEKVWNSIAARMAFIPPDLKPLPNVIISSSASQQNIALVKQMETSIFQRGPESPSAEYLSFRAITIIQEAVALNSPVTDSPVILTHTHMLLYLYKKLYVESQDETSRKAALEEAWSISGPPVSSVTHKTFWIQVLVAAVTRENREQTIDDCPPVGAAMCFESFIRRNSFLAYEALWSVYYSPEIWYSEEAAEMFIAPDRRKIAGSLAPGSMEKLFE